MSGIELRILVYAACSLVTLLNGLPERVMFEETYTFLSPSINIVYCVCVAKFLFPSPKILYLEVSCVNDVCGYLV